MIALIPAICGECEHDYIYRYPFSFSICYVLLLLCGIKILSILVMCFITRADRPKKVSSLVYLIFALDFVLSTLPFATSFVIDSRLSFINLGDGLIGSLFLLLVTDVIGHGKTKLSLKVLVNLLVSLNSITLILGSISNIFSNHQDLFASMFQWYDLILLGSIIARIPINIFISKALFDSFHPYQEGATYSNLQNDELRNPLLYYSTSHQDISQDNNQQIYNHIEKRKSYYQIFMFSWLNPMFSIAQDRVLEQSDLFVLPQHMTCQFNDTLLGQRWRIRKSVALALYDVYFVRYMQLGFFILLASLLTFIGPLSLELLISIAEHGAPMETIVLVIAFLFLSKVVTAFCTAHYLGRATNMATSISSGEPTLN